MTEKILLIIIWFIAIASLWVFATNTTVTNEKYKHYEFRFRSFFYWLAAVLSLIVGYIL